MAASTLHTLLIKLGFDTSQMASGANAAKGQMAGVGQAAQNMAGQIMPSVNAMNNLVRALDAIKGKTGARQTMDNIVGGINAIRNSAQGSVAGMNAFAQGVANVASATGATGSSVNQFVRGAERVIAATNGATAALKNYVNMATLMARAGGGNFGGIAQQAINQFNQAQAAAGAQGNVAGAANQAAGAHQRAANAANANAAAHGNLVPAANKAAQSMNGVAAAADHVSNRASFMQRTLSMAFAFGGGVAVTNLIGFIGNALVGMNSRLEQAKITFESFMGDSAMADEFINKMLRFAEVTPFEFPGLLEAVQRLQAMGFQAEDSLIVLQAVGDAASAFPGGSLKEKLDRITIALGQMSTAGRVNAQDMRQLTEAGIPAWEMLAQGIGKTTAETRKLAENGVIPASQAVGILLAGMEERFGGMMQKQARTAAGAFTTIKDAALVTMSDAVRPLFEMVHNVLVVLADWLIAGNGKYIAPMIQAIGVAIAVALIPSLYGAAVAAASFSVAIGMIEIPLLALTVAISAFALAWQENFLGIQDVFGPIIAAVLGFGESIYEAAKNAGVLVPIIGAIAILITTKLIVGLIQWAFWTAVLIAENYALTAATNAASASMLGQAASAGVLTGALTTLRTVLTFIVGLLGGAAVVATAGWIVVLALLVTQWEQVNQGARALAYGFVGAIKTMVDVAAMVPILGEPFKALSGILQDELNKIEQDVYAADARIRAAQKTAAEAATPGAEDIMGDWQARFDAMMGRWQSDAPNKAAATGDEMVERFGMSIEGIVAAARESSAEAMRAMAEEIQSHQNEPIQAFKDLRDALKNEMDPMREIALLTGLLAGPELAAGLASGVPATRAVAEATRLTWLERMAELKGEAMPTGQAISTNLAAGIGGPSSVSAVEGALVRVGAPVANFFDKAFGTDMFSRGLSTLATPFLQAAGPINGMNNALKGFVPTQEMVNEELRKMNQQLNETENSQAISKLNSAFNDIRDTAHKFFDQLHRDNLEAISDAVKHKNAIIDAKMELNQAPVTAAQKALDFQRREMERWRLQQAIATADNPEEYRDAVLAYRDFLAQVHVDEMQAQVDSANEVLEEQKRKNEDLADQQREAEDERYRLQVVNFDRQLELLRRYLEQHPGEWQKTEERIIDLLRGYGVTYEGVGEDLGQAYVDGLKEKIDEAEEAAKMLAGPVVEAAGSAYDAIYKVTQVASLLTGLGGIFGQLGTKGTQGGGMIGPGGEWSWMGPTHHGGLWDSANEHLALIQKNEAVLPPATAELFRQAFGGAQPSRVGASDVLGSRIDGRETNLRPIVVQVGDQKLAEITDRQMSGREATYGSERPRVNTGSMR